MLQLLCHCGCYHVIVVVVAAVVHVAVVISSCCSRFFQVGMKRRIQHQQK